MNVTHAETPRRRNRLGREKSPYLLQHQYNPVDWHAWGKEAFDLARSEDRPVFLSIGYSTCHWCHVMERESFEDEVVGRFLNEHFVSIKVDREERPDVDKIYMTFVQATTGQGGWPLNVFLTPERKPFFGGTYYPPENRHGRPGFLTLLKQVREVWQRRRQEIDASANDIHAQLAQLSASGAPSPVVLTAEVVRQAGLTVKSSYDPQHGGFGNAPKFPQPSQPRMLLRYARRFQDQEAAQMVLRTCDRMAAGGIHDQLGGGFARYSVDAQWLVPHFEKMLYDNAQLADLYLDAYVLSGEARYARVARTTLDYVLRDMTHPEGGFYSAEDADSEGHEGKFYCWTKADLRELLAEEEFQVATRYFGVTEQGNFVDHSHPIPLAGQNVLSIADPNVPARQQAALASATRKLLAARSGRVRPHLDDKVLASWNGLMLGAMARAGIVLGDETYLRAAEKNLGFLRANLWDATGERLHHRWREEERDSAQLLESYASVLWGALRLYEATLEPGTLGFGIRLAEKMVESFYDAENGGFWQAGPEASDLILRVKEDYDGAEPSGNSMAIHTLLKLGHITGRKDFLEAAEKTLRLFSQRLQRLPQALPCMVSALDFSLEPPSRVVLAGHRSGIECQALLRTAHSVYQPNKVVLGTSGPVEPFAAGLPRTAAPVIYLCTGTACQAPTADAEQVRRWLLARE